MLLPISVSAKAVRILAIEEAADCGRNFEWRDSNSGIRYFNSRKSALSKPRSTAAFLIPLASLLLILLGASPLGRSAQAQFQIGIGAQREPRLAVDQDNNLFLVMAVATKPASAGTPGSQIFFTESTDGGQHWDNMPLTRNLSNSPITGLGALFPRIAITRTGRTRAYVVYDDDTGGPRQAYSIRSKKNTAFKRPEILSSGNDGGFTPVVDVDSMGNVEVAWASSMNGPRQVQFVRSTDLGVTFTKPINISKSAGEGFAPVIAVDDSDAVNLAWQDSGSPPDEILFSRSTDGGSTFSAPKKLSSGPAPASAPEIVMDRLGGLSVLWIEPQTGGGSRILVSRTIDGGQTFSVASVVASSRSADFSDLAVCIGRNITYLVFTDNNAGQVFLTQSQSDLLSFSSPRQISHSDTSKGVAHSPSVAVDGNGRIHAVWIDSSILGNDEGLLVYRSSSDGQTFTAPVLILAIVQPTSAVQPISGGAEKR